MVKDADPDSRETEASFALLRYRYRKEFKLTSQQMLDEPMSEIVLTQAIWKAQSDREALEERRNRRNR